MLKRLQLLSVKAIEWAINALCQDNQLDPEHITTCILVGNSIMTHIFVGENPQSLGKYPYSPRFKEGRTYKAKTLGFTFNPDATIQTLPLVSGFLGSDIVAAGLSIEIDGKPPGTMLVDVGTNGEILLVSDKGLWATSCATGPAFEGATIRHGMRAVSGAIDRIAIDRKSNEPVCTIIQKEHAPAIKPSGICGTGVISAIAELHRAGLVGKDGRFRRKGTLTHFQYSREGYLEFILVPFEKSQTQRAITLTQKDIRSIQLAKGALLAGIELMCEKAEVSSIKNLWIAGAFGSYINKKDARTIGMFPEISDENIRIIGNGAGAGAILCLINPALCVKAREIAENIHVLNLATLPEFQKKFIHSLSLDS
jgi:uncharacterized 2Fe-2S/4Fe-4S cluster protein (DUF4445 family)